MPVADFAAVPGWESEASNGASFGVHFALTSGHVGYLVGLNEYRFKCPTVGCGAETDLVSAAWDIGLRINLRMSGVVPWLRVGAITELLEAGPGHRGIHGRFGDSARGIRSYVKLRGGSRSPDSRG
jgi:hypothetical protein